MKSASVAVALITAMTLYWGHHRDTSGRPTDVELKAARVALRAGWRAGWAVNIVLREKLFEISQIDRGGLVNVPYGSPDTDALGESSTKCMTDAAGH